MKKQKTLRMTQLALLIAITLLMSFTPLGYLKVGALSITLLTIPVAVAAIVLGPTAGAIVGAVFGLTSFYQCFGLDAFGVALLEINPFYTFLVCVPTRILTGYLTGVTYRLCVKVDKKRTISCFVASFMSTMFNSIFFMGTLVLCFWNCDVIQNINAGFGGVNPIMFILLLSGVNSLVEKPTTCIIGGIVTKTLNKFVNKEVIALPSKKKDHQAVA